MSPLAPSEGGHAPPGRLNRSAVTDAVGAEWSWQASLLSHDGPRRPQFERYYFIGGEAPPLHVKPESRGAIEAVFIGIRSPPQRACRGGGSGQLDVPVSSIEELSPRGIAFVGEFDAQDRVPPRLDGRSDQSEPGLIRCAATFSDIAADTRAYDVFPTARPAL